MPSRGFEIAFKRPVATLAAIYVGALGLYGAIEYSAGQMADLMYGGNAAMALARDQGYRDISLEHVDHGFVGFGECRGKQDVQYELEATAPAGGRVDLDVCKSLIGGAELIP